MPCKTHTPQHGTGMLSSKFRWRMSGLKLGEVLASTSRLHHSLGGLPRIFEFQRSSRVQS